MNAWRDEHGARWHEAYREGFINAARLGARGRARLEDRPIEPAVAHAHRWALEYLANPETTPHPMPWPPPEQDTNSREDM